MGRRLRVGRSLGTGLADSRKVLWLKVVVMVMSALRRGARQELWLGLGLVLEWVAALELGILRSDGVMAAEEGSGEARRCGAGFGHLWRCAAPRVLRSLLFVGGLAFEKKMSCRLGDVVRIVAA